MWALCLAEVPSIAVGSEESAHCAAGFGLYGTGSSAGDVVLCDDRL